MLLSDGPTKLVLKKLTVAGIDFYVSPHARQVFHADAVAAALLDAWCQGSPPVEAATDLVGQYGEAAVEEAMRELEQFALSGLLFEHLAVAGCPATSSGKEGSNGAGKSLSLEVSASCNLRCTYCYQQGSQRHGRMTWEVARQSIDFLQANSRPGELWEINFYGGEPLLNADLIWQVVDYAEKEAHETDCEVTFQINTNGTLLDEEIVEALARYRFEVFLSLDGRSTTHDRYRRTASGSGTHATIVQKVPLLLRHLPAERLLVLMVVTHETIDELERNFAYLWNLGLYRIFIQPIILTEQTNLALGEEDVKRLARFYERLILTSPDPPERIGHNPALNRYWHRIDGKKKYVSCNACDGRYFVNASGVLYPCTIFSTLGHYSIGDVWQGINQTLSSSWLQDRATVDASPRCRDCWARYYCGGGCYAQAWKQNHNVRLPHGNDCLMRQTMIESALRIRLRLILERTARQCTTNTK